MHTLLQYDSWSFVLVTKGKQKREDSGSQREPELYRISRATSNKNDNDFDLGNKINSLQL
jgi:hypothetical protein